MSDFPDPIGDQALIQRLQTDDAQALEDIFDTYFIPLVRFATGIVLSRAIAEELALDALTALWERRAVLRIDTTIRAYLYRSIRNRAKNELRSRRREVARFEQHAGEHIVSAIAFPSIPVDDQLEFDERLAAVRAAIAALPEPRRTIIILRWSRQMSFAEIAHIVGITDVAARAHVSRALVTLRALLQTEFD